MSFRSFRELSAPAWSEWLLAVQSKALVEAKMGAHVKEIRGGTNRKGELRAWYYSQVGLLS